MPHNRFAVIDVETAGDETALPLLEPPDAPKNLKDPEKIKAAIEERTAAQIEQCSLDPFAGRIVCIGYRTEAGEAVAACRNEVEERMELTHLASVLQQRQVIGFCCGRFDMPWLVTRARLLGVPFPTLDTRKYGNRDITDLHSLLTFEGNMPDGAFKRSLKNFARRFGLEVSDDVNGCDVATLVREGRYDEVEAHCLSDVRLTHMLAQRLGLVPAPEWDLAEELAR